MYYLRRILANNRNRRARTTLTGEETIRATGITTGVATRVVERTTERVTDGTVNCLVQFPFTH